MVSSHLALRIFQQKLKLAILCQSIKKTSSLEFTGKTWTFWLNPGSHELIVACFLKCWEMPEAQCTYSTSSLTHLGVFQCSLSHGPPVYTRRPQGRLEGCCHSIKMDIWSV